MRFQGLAVVLGKKRWPELIARQRKKDFGLDAYAPSSLSAEKIGKGLAASITPTLKKISADAKTAKENFPDLKTLLFVTSAKVGNADRKQWEEAIQKEHGLELHIIEREEIITSMMMPENASLLASFLRLDVDVDRIVLDMDSSESPVHGAQEGSAYNGHFESVCYHPLFLFNEHGDCLGATLRPGNVHSAEDWDDLLVPEIERQQAEGKCVAFRADAAFAKPEIYDALEQRDVEYAIRIPANKSLELEIEDILFRPRGRPSRKPLVRYKSFRYQAESWATPRRIVAKVEHHPGELFPRVGFIVTNLRLPSRAVVRFYNKRGTAEQWIKEGKQAAHWTRLSCHRFRANEVRLQLSVLAYNLGNLWRRLVLPKRIDTWSLTSLQQRLVKTGGRLIKHARYYWLLLAESHLTRRLFGAMLRRIWALPVPTG